MKLVQTTFTGYCWKSGMEDVDRCVQTSLIDDDGKVFRSVSFSEGEPEDMTLNRDLNDAYDIFDLVKQAYDLGKKGVELNFDIKSEEY